MGRIVYMSLKHTTYLEFLTHSPRKTEVDEYMSVMTEQNQIEFKNLVLFSQYGLEQLAKTEKLIKFGDTFISRAALLTVMAATAITVALNYYLFHFGLIGFLGLFAVMNLTGLLYVTNVRKTALTIPHSKLWHITIHHYTGWVARDSDEFIQVLKDFNSHISESKVAKMSDRFMNLIFNK